MLYFLALILGITAGLRAATPLAAVAIGVWLGWIDLSGTWAGFMDTIGAAIILGLAAITELVDDQLPNTPSHRSPPQFTGRIVTGAFAGAIIGSPSGNWLAGLIAGAIGAVLGTLGGYEARKRVWTRPSRRADQGLDRTHPRLLGRTLYCSSHGRSRGSLIGSRKLGLH